MDIWGYDIECYINCFMVTFKHKDSGVIRRFLIYKDPDSSYEVKQYHDLVAFCNRPETLWLIGYNNYSYDNQLLNFLILSYWSFKDKTAAHITKEAYKVSQEYFATQNSGGYYVKYWYANYFNSVDLMRVAGLHKPSTRKALKQIAVNLKHNRIEDLPIPFDKPVKKEQLEKLFDYNLNDVEITLALYSGPKEYVYSPFVPKRRKNTGLAEAVRLRYAITNEYEIDVMNQDKSGMANKLLENLYSQRTGQHPAGFRDLRTKRFAVNFEDAIFDTIKFKSPELNKWLDFLKTQSVLTNSEEKITIKLPTFWYGGLEYQFSAGGLHSVDKGAVFEATDKIRIIDADAGSFHPRVMINHGIRPAHLDPVFNEILEEQTDSRLLDKKTAKAFKAAGDKTMQAKFETAAESKKILINSIFGKLGSGTSWLYDPLAMVQVTINNQLYIMMLAEKFVMAGFKVISANTDGLTTLVDRDREDEYMELCKEWEKETRFELEYAYYQKYIRRDVNNYLVLKELNEGEKFDYDTHIKCKGDLDPFLYETIEKGFDKPVISLAVYNHFINGIPIQKTIREHTDIYDYCMSKKNDSTYDNEFHTVVNGEYIKTTLQKSNRFYISEGSGNGMGGKLIKAKDTYTPEGTKGKRKQAQQVAREYVTIFNDFIERDSMKDYNIKYMYYIVQTQKLIDAIIPKQQSLFF